MGGKMQILVKLGLRGSPSLVRLIGYCTLACFFACAVSAHAQDLNQVYQAQYQRVTQIDATLSQNNLSSDQIQALQAERQGLVQAMQSEIASQQGAAASGSNGAGTNPGASGTGGQPSGQCPDGSVGVLGVCSGGVAPQY
jgi:hypothetical protein